MWYNEGLPPSLTTSCLTPVVLFKFWNKYITKIGLAFLLMNFYSSQMEVPKASRNCFACGRELLPGETFFSVVFEEGDVVVRRDFAGENWKEPPENFIAWWKTTVPKPNDKKNKLAPNDVLLNLFNQIRNNDNQADLLYVLSLLLIRRRLFRYEREEKNDTDPKNMIVYSIKENSTFEIPIAMPNRNRLEEIQTQLTELLYD
ncbi:MAG: hypothetical protein LBQ66_08800 [Planctomycetaceae bacterium]|nr:hypothetical protein [Planctomycetaceae bacterium]